MINQFAKAQEVVAAKEIAIVASHHAMQALEVQALELESEKHKMIVKVTGLEVLTLVYNTFKMPSILK